jgi:Domain of unknown function (DUF4349)
MTPSEPFTEDEGMVRLERELRAERAEPDPEFAAALDRWAAEGFPRASRPGHVPGRIERLRDRLASVPPRRLLAPAGAAVALVAVVGIAVTTVEIDRGGDGDRAGNAGGEAGSDDAGAGSAPAAESGTAERAAEGGGRLLQEEAVGDELAGAAGRPVRPRRIAQTADLVLATEPDRIGEVSDGVNEVVNRYRGFVISSSVSSGDSGGGGLGAQFRMKIPARNLQAALAGLSELAHVRSRTEGTEDITGRFSSAQERIEESQALRESLLKQLAEAFTESERNAIQARIRAVNGQIAAARADLEAARQRVRLVPVTLSVVAEEGADDDGDWSIADALDDAGQVLSTTAGVIVVAGAVLLPVALVGLALALAMRTRASRGRERALDE